MKKNVLLLVTAILVHCGGLMGQTPIETAIISPATGGNVCGIVRTWKASWAVACDQNSFSLIDSTTNIVYSANAITSIPGYSNYTINDMQIVGDTAYCGGFSGSDAMIAYFNINDLLASGSIAFGVVIVNNIDQVTKLAAYRNTRMNGVGIAAIGTRKDPEVPSIEKYYMIECNNYGGSPTFSASSRECFTQSQIETLTDVVVTENYVGFVGIMTNTYEVCIRRGDKNGIFASTLIDTIHRYGYGATMIKTPPVAETLDGDKIAVAADFVNEYPSGTEHSAQIFLFNLANMDFFDAWSMIQPDVISVTDLVYMPSKRILLMAIVSSDGGYFVVHTLPFSPIDYTASVMVLKNREDICSMDFRNSSYFILSTQYHWMLQKLTNPCLPNSCIEARDVEFFHVTVSIDGPLYHVWIWSYSRYYLDKLPQNNFVYSLDCVAF